MVNIAKLIRVGRAKKNLKQNDLARELSVAPSAVSQWESGKKTPTGDTLIKIANLLDIVEELFPGYVKESEKPLEEPDVQKLAKKIISIENRLAVLEQKNNL